MRTRRTTSAQGSWFRSSDGTRRRRLPASEPYAVAIGSALIAWWSRDPEPSTTKTGGTRTTTFIQAPWLCHGCLPVAATSIRDLQLLRYPNDSVAAKPLNAGCYLHLYWVSAGRNEDNIARTNATNNRLRAGDRIHLKRTHLHDLPGLPGAPPAPMVRRRRTSMRSVMAIPAW